MIIALVCWYLYPENEGLSYEIFMWGDIGLVSDVRYYGVAPHWYFRPFMAWLIVCPHHKTGVFGLIFFFWILIQQPSLHGVNEKITQHKRKIIFVFFCKTKKINYFSPTFISNIELNFFHQISYIIFLMCMLYTTTFLPYGRFYNRLGGNITMLGAYFFIFFWLTFTIFRRPLGLEIKFTHICWVPYFLQRKYIKK